MDLSVPARQTEFWCLSVTPFSDWERDEDRKDKRQSAPGTDVIMIMLEDGAIHLASYERMIR